MRALDRKLLRDLREIKGQALAIGAVIAVGVAMLIAYLSTFDSLERTRDAYYQRSRMADVFASLKRAPRSLEPRLATIPGVARLETRVVAEVTLDVAGTDAPVTGHLVSVPETRTPLMNDLTILRGRYLEAGRRDEVLVNEGFALAHHLGPGDTVAALLNGRRRQLAIVGIALSPEFVYTIRPGDLMPDDSRFGVLWIGRKALADVFDMEGGFNDVVAALSPGASADEVVARLDRLLAPYGGLGALPRRLQTSTWYLDNEMRQLRGFGMLMPMVFLAVAAFLLNVVLQRIVAVQREQVAELKALGYGNWTVGWHYAQWSLLIALGGGVAGVGLGAWLGGAMIRMYNDYFRFPFLEYRLSPAVVAGALAVSTVAAALGAVSSVRRAVTLPPAEAMRPEPPARYRRTVVERLGLSRWLSPPVRMVLRNFERRPLRALVLVVGVAAAGALVEVGLFFLDSIDVVLDVEFHLAQRQDLTVSFVEPRSAAALHEVARLPGVFSAEPARNVPVRLVAGHRSRHAVVTGLVADPRLRRVVDAAGRPRPPAPEGVLMTAALAEVLGLAAGDTLTLEVLEGARPVRRVRLAALVDEFMGTNVYMEAGALHRLLREGPSLSGAYLEVDPARAVALYERLKRLPAVAGVALKSATLDAFNRQMDETMGVFIFFNLLFASTIAVGVVYNAARVALSERTRELASLRVLGFTRGEISFILLGELAVITALAIPLGLAVGYGLGAFIVAAFETELYRFPVVVSARTAATSVLVVVAAAALSALLVRRRLDHLDLVEALKTRE